MTNHQDALTKALEALEIAHRFINPHAKWRNGYGQTVVAMNDAAIAINAIDTALSALQQSDISTQSAGQVEREMLEVIAERDRAQDALLEASEIMGGPEWCAKIPPEPAPDSGDLHEDVPELCRQLIAECDELRAQVAALSQPDSTKLRCPLCGGAGHVGEEPEL